MSYFLARRVLQTLIAALFVAVLVFGLARLSGDPVPLMMPADATAEEVSAFRQQLGLDRSLPEQFLIFLGNVAQGEFGTSLRYNQDAMGLVLSRVPATALLAVTALALAVICGIPLGIAAALNRGTWLDQAIRAVATLGQATPSFWLAVMLVLVFAVTLRWLPTSGYGAPAYIVLPALTLGWEALSYVTRLTRSSVIEALQSDFVKLETLSGVPRPLIVYKHVLRNASIPVLTFTALQFGGLLGGAVVTETIFGWPGLGQLTVNAIMQRDFPVIQAAVTLIAVFFLVINLLVDISYRLLDPRVRI